MSDGIMIRAEDLYRTYHNGERAVFALRGVSLELRPGSCTAILGRNGGGKTTLLRILAGIDRCDSGKVSCFRSGMSVDQKDFRTGFVFQEPRLLPWLDVEHNLSFALEGRCCPGMIRERIENILDLFGLAAFRNAFPSELSGGIEQKTALGRALAFEPDVLLLDEPSRALDRPARTIMRRKLKEVQRNSGATLCLVSHDIEEALEVGECIVVMESGRIVAEFSMIGKNRGKAHVDDIRRRLRGLLPGHDDEKGD